MKVGEVAKITLQTRICLWQCRFPARYPTRLIEYPYWPLPLFSTRAA
ncbi:hypothetical protein OIU78_005525 [Salix suchowensis]|nr:hypothetical protein OIU78_005525 [Salix suchowensis]